MSFTHHIVLPQSWPKHFLLLSDEQDICSEITSKKSPVNESYLKSTQFLQDNREKLDYEQQEDLNNKTVNLRETYDRLDVRSQDWLKESQDELERLKRERAERVSSRVRISVTTLVSWRFTIMASLHPGVYMGTCKDEVGIVHEKAFGSWSWHLCPWARYFTTIIASLHPGV